MQMLMAAASGGAITFSATLNNILSGTTGLRSAGFSMLNDGTGTTSRSPAGGTGTATTGPWYFPNPTAAIGSNYWVKLTINTQSLTTISGSATATVISLSSTVGWTFTNSATNTEGTGTGTVSIYADSGGTILVATASVSWDVGFTP